MSNNSKLTPKLRFPEYRGKGEWTPHKFGDFVVKSFYGTSASTSEAGRYPVLRMGNMSEGGLDFTNLVYIDLDPEQFESFRLLKGDILLNRTNSRELVGKISMFDRHSECITASYIVSFRMDEKRIDPQFCNLMLNTLMYQSRIRLLATPSISQANINPTTLRTSLDIAVPSLPEQRKIADCLSSLDELIAAEGRKLESLRTYKKGLMQQLFPGPGESRPGLRFPEFHDAGEWVKKPFSDLCDINHGYAFEGEYFNNEGKYVLLTPGNFYEQGGYRDRGEQQKYYTGEIPRDYVLAQGDMLVAMTEQAAGLLGSPILVPQSDKFLHNQRLGLVTGKPGVAWANEFFFHVFNTEPVRKAIHDTASGTKVRHTSPTKIGEVAVSAPTSSFEQQRIAACLSSLDGLLLASSRKVEALKQHKKGLMQQLFPSTAEV